MTPTASLLARADAVTIRDRGSGRQAPPAVFSSASGAWCTDIEGKRYVDLTASSGAVLLGHGDKIVAEAVVAAVRDGAVGLADTVTIPLVEVAERLVVRYPAAERVAFFRTGSEATTAAVRLVRATTGRRWILSSGYHGWHDWQLGIRGFNANINQGIIHFGYHLEALDSLLDALAGQLAGVMVSPEPAWVSVDAIGEMSEMCRRASVPFMLDEVMTGLRYGASGVNGSGVRADVITLAKGLANGHSIAAVAGRDEIVGAYHAANLGGTYNREVAPLVAARAVLDATESGSMHQRSSEVGTAIKEGIRSALNQSGVSAWTGGPGMMFDVVMPNDACAKAFFAEMFRQGVHMDHSGTQFVTGAHSAREVDVVVTAAHASAAFVAEAFPELPEVDHLRMEQFAWDAFGGVTAARPDWRSEVEHVLDVVAAKVRP